ncbi:hypothetical protein Tco_0639098 [Tanacetum coccineum]
MGSRSYPKMANYNMMHCHSDPYDWANQWKPKDPWDIPMESRNAEMFSLTYGLSFYHIRTSTSARFYISIMEGFINHLWKIGNPSFQRKARLVVVMILVEHQALKKMNLEIHRGREVFTENDGWDRASDFRI